MEAYGCARAGKGGSASRSAHGGRGMSAAHHAVAPGAGQDQATAPRQSRADHSRLGIHHPTAKPNLPRSRWRSGGQSGTRSAAKSDGGQRPASFAYRRENRTKQKISSSVRRQHSTTSPATRIPSSCDARPVGGRAKSNAPFRIESHNAEKTSSVRRKQSTTSPATESHSRWRR